MNIPEYDVTGRKVMLVTTLLLMGVATFLIGLLPNYAQIGVWAPIALLLLRILQGPRYRIGFRDIAALARPDALGRGRASGTQRW